jgi:hypothetical protein
MTECCIERDMYLLISAQLAEMLIKTTGDYLGLMDMKAVACFTVPDEKKGARTATGVNRMAMLAEQKKNV